MGIKYTSTAKGGYQKFSIISHENKSNPTT